MAQSAPSVPGAEAASGGDYSGPTCTYSHPQLGDMRARLVSNPHFPGINVVHFRSIPFATIPARFLPAVQLQEIPQSFDDRPYRDFTQSGTACPQQGALSPGWNEPQGGILNNEVWTFDEFTCLSLSISVPESHLSRADKYELGAGKALPVLVYVHGGGAEAGLGHIDELHNNTPLTAFAETINSPVITVNISYRLNWFGGLACQDLLDEYHANPGTSPHGPFNLNLQDQKAAFAWIHQFIGGFGGNPLEITAFGESAGSILLTYLIAGSSEALFKRAILQSGVPITSQSLESKEAEYQALLKHLNVQGETWQERLSALRKVDASALIKIPGSHMMPFIGDIAGLARQDSLFTRGMPTFANQSELIASNSWLGDIIIGDTFFEGVVFIEMLQQRQFSSSFFIQLIQKMFPSPQAQELLAAYDMPTSGSMDSNRFLLQVSYFIGDLVFSAPVHEMANHLSWKACTDGTRRIYRYCFGLSNPFLGSTLGYIPGHHFVEILYVFLTLLDRYPTRRDHWIEKQARETAKRWVSFANGQAPWTKYEVSRTATGTSGQEGMIEVKDAKIAIADDIHGWTIRTMSEDEELSKSDPWGERRYAARRALESAYLSLKTEGLDDGAWHANVDHARQRILTWAFLGI